MKIGTMMVIGLSLVGSVAAAQVEKEAYIELTEAQMLRVIDQNQSRTLVNLERVEAGTILGVDIASLSKALELQSVIPNEVNYTYTNEKGEKLTSKNGFLCNVRLVDVPNDKQRESEIMERTDLCVSLVNVQKKASIMAGNEPRIKAALEQVQQENKTDLLVAKVQSNANEMLMDYAGEMINPIVDFVAGGSTFVKPLERSLVVTSEFGMRRHPVYRTGRLHKGIDLKAATGTSIRSALKGRVLALKTERGHRGSIKGYGHYVIVVHPDRGMQTLYAHLSAFKTKAGASVAAGERIALSGATGVGTGPHLHFETHVGSRPVNPRKFISAMLSSVGKFIEEFLMIGQRV